MESHGERLATFSDIQFNAILGNLMCIREFSFWVPHHKGSDLIINEKQGKRYGQLEQ